MLTAIWVKRSGTQKRSHRLTAKLPQLFPNTRRPSVGWSDGAYGEADFASLPSP